MFGFAPVCRGDNEQVVQILSQLKATLASAGLSDAQKIEATQLAIQGIEQSCTTNCPGVIDTIKAFEPLPSDPPRSGPTAENAAKEESYLESLFTQIAAGFRQTPEGADGSVEDILTAAVDFASGRRSGESLSAWIGSAARKILTSQSAKTTLIGLRTIAIVEVLKFAHKHDGKPSQRIRQTLEEARRKKELEFLELQNVNLDDVPLEILDTPLVGLDDLKKSLVELRTVLLDPSVEQELKSIEIDRVFAQIEVVGEKNWNLVLEALDSASNATSTPQNFKNSLLNEPSQEKAVVSEIEIGHIIQAFRNHPEFLLKQMRASLKFLRYLVSVEEQALFDVLSQDPHKTQAGHQAIEKDLRFFKAQISALSKVAVVVAAIARGREPTSEQVNEMVVGIHGLGLFYMKLAQTASSLGFMMGDQVARPLKVFQDAMEPMPLTDVDRIILEDFGQTRQELFSEFELIATGSIANTYKVKVRRTGKIMAFKVRREGLIDDLNWNRKLNRIVIKAGEAFTPSAYAPILDFVTSQIIGLEDAFESETDFKLEARNIEKFRRLFWFDRDIKIPKTFSEFTTKRTIGMEFIDGRNIDKTLDIQLSWLNSKDKTLKELGEATSLYELGPSDAWSLRKFTYERLVDLKTSDPEEYEKLQRDFGVARLDLILSCIRKMDPVKFQVEMRQIADEVSGYEFVLSRLVRSFLYMLFAGDLHADLHPGNIMEMAAKVESGRKKLAIFDFGQVARTRGLVLDPILATYHLMMGNAESFGKAFSKLGRKKGHNQEKLIEIAKQVFAQHGIPRQTVKDFLYRRYEGMSGATVAALLRDFLSRASTEAEFRYSPRNAQVLRSLIPISGLLMSVGSRIPFSRVLIVGAKEALLALPMGALKKTALMAPVAMGGLADRAMEWAYDFRRARHRDRLYARMNTKSGEKKSESAREPPPANKSGWWPACLNFMGRLARP